MTSKGWWGNLVTVFCCLKGGYRNHWSTLFPEVDNKSHEAMDMSCTEENPDQIQRIKSSQWEWLILGWGFRMSGESTPLKIFTAQLDSLHGMQLCLEQWVELSTSRHPFLMWHFPPLLAHCSLMLCHTSLICLASCFHGLCRGSVFWCTATHRCGLCFCWMVTQMAIYSTVSCLPFSSPTLVRTYCYVYALGRCNAFLPLDWCSTKPTHNKRHKGGYFIRHLLEYLVELLWIHSHSVLITTASELLPQHIR